MWIRARREALCGSYLPLKSVDLSFKFHPFVLQGSNASFGQKLGFGPATFEPVEQWKCHRTSLQEH